MKIQFVRLNSCLLITPTFKKRSATFLQEIEHELKQKLTEIKDFRQLKGLTLLYIESGGTEEIFKKNYHKFPPPYLLLASDFNNSLAASLEILHFLNLHHLSGEIIHGNTKYIVSRIKHYASKTR